MNLSEYDGAEIADLEYRIEQGVVFEIAGTQSVANDGARIEWLFRTGSKRVLVYQRRVVSNGDELTYQAFAGPTISADGDPVTPTNRLGTKGKATTCEVFSAPTVTEDGAGLQPVYMPGVQGNGNRSTGQFNLEGAFRLLEPHTEYLATIVNDGTATTAKCELYLLWAEMENNQ